MGSNRLGQHRTIQPIKKPLNIEFKGFFKFRGITSERILVGWRELKWRTK